MSVWQAEAAAAPPPRTAYMMLNIIGKQGINNINVWVEQALWRGLSASAYSIISLEAAAAVNCRLVKSCSCSSFSTATTQKRKKKKWWRAINKERKKAWRHWRIAVSQQDLISMCATTMAVMMMLLLYTLSIQRMSAKSPSHQQKREKCIGLLLIMWSSAHWSGRKSICLPSSSSSSSRLVLNPMSLMTAQITISPSSSAKMPRLIGSRPVCSAEIKFIQIEVGADAFFYIGRYINTRALCHSLFNEVFLLLCLWISWCMASAAAAAEFLNNKRRISFPSLFFFLINSGAVCVFFI